jgi:protein SHQ1
MPITPRFAISQTDEDIVIVISVSHIRVSANSLEVVIEDDHILHFYAAPYLLKLAFGEGRVGGLNDDNHDDCACRFATNADEECSTYDPGSGGQDATLTLRLAKAVSGVEWPQLDLTARLMQPKAIPMRYDWLKQVVDNEDYTNAETNKNDISELEAGEEPLENSAILPDMNDHHSVDGYGFASMFHNIFNDFCRDGLAKEMLQLQHPEDTTNEERRQQRLEREGKDFDVDRYLGDLNLSESGEEDYLYAMAMAFESHWRIPSQSISSSPPPSNSDDTIISQQLNQLSIEKKIVETNDINKGQNEATCCTTATSSHTDAQSKPNATYFASDEQLLLATIPYPLLPETILAQCKTDHENAESESSWLWNGLLDILFAYVYDHLLTQGEATVESAWTISTLSCSLSWLDNSRGFTSFNDSQSGGVGDVVTASLRRTLIYPYFRNLEFGLHVWNQVCEILQFPSDATKCVIRCMLQVRTILEQSELYYLGNKLYIDPYLAWLQRRTAPIPSEVLVEHIRRTISGQSTSSLKETIGLRLIESEQLLLHEDHEGNDTSDGEHSASTSSDDDDDDDDEEGEADSDDETSVPCTAEGTKQDKFSNSDLAPQEQRATLAPDLNRSIVSNALMDSELGAQSSLLEIIPMSSNTADCVEDIEGDNSSKKKLLIQELK